MRKIKYLYDVSELRKVFRYDPITGILYRHFNKSGEREAGTLFNTGHMQVGFKRRMIGVHRIAWALHSGEYPSIEVDHINGNGADNRICNLRLATSSQNNQNRRLSTRNKTGVKGVFRVKRGKPWRVSVCVDGKYRITQFDDFDVAVKYADALRQKLHQEFAKAA